jgi:MoaA/NifB/PqqE/SkfB family radical SAM enzyme
MFGEPLWNRRIYDIIRQVSKRNVTTSISTNFHIFSEKDADKLIDSQLTWILVCIDGADQPTYQKYRVGGNLAKVLHNLELLIRRKRERGAKNPLIEVQSIVFEHNRHQIENIKKMCLSLGVERFTTKADVLPQVRRTATPETQPMRPGATCFFLYGSFMVDYDGAVIPCCLGRYEFGNILNSSFEEVWNGERFVAARAWFASGYKKKNERFDLPCYHCPLFRKQ